MSNSKAPDLRHLVNQLRDEIEDPRTTVDGKHKPTPILDAIVSFVHQNTDAEFGHVGSAFHVEQLLRILDAGTLEEAKMKIENLKDQASGLLHVQELLREKQADNVFDRIRKLLHVEHKWQGHERLFAEALGLGGRTTFEDCLARTRKLVAYVGSVPAPQCLVTGHVCAGKVQGMQESSARKTANQDYATASVAASAQTQLCDALAHALCCEPDPASVESSVQALLKKEPIQHHWDGLCRVLNIPASARGAHLQVLGEVELLKKRNSYTRRLAELLGLQEVTSEAIEAAVEALVAQKGSSPWPLLAQTSTVGRAPGTGVQPPSGWKLEIDAWKRQWVGAVQTAAELACALEESGQLTGALATDWRVLLVCYKSHHRQDPATFPALENMSSEYARLQDLVAASRQPITANWLPNRRRLELGFSPDASSSVVFRASFKGRTRDAAAAVALADSNVRHWLGLAVEPQEPSDSDHDPL